MTTARAIFFVAALALAAVVYVRVTGLSTVPEPGAMEAAAARVVRRFAVPADVRARTNPVPQTPETLEAALEHFADHCASCHANDGSGRTDTGARFYPRAPDMRGPATQAMTDGELFWVIENGIRFTGMPGWSTGTPGGEEDSWKLVQFIRHLPQLTDEEKARMAALNPRSPEQIRHELEEERFLSGTDTP